MDDINSILRDLSLFEPNSSNNIGKSSRTLSTTSTKSAKPCRPPPPPPVKPSPSSAGTFKKAAIPLPNHHSVPIQSISNKNTINGINGNKYDSSISSNNNNNNSNSTLATAVRATVETKKSFTSNTSSSTPMNPIYNSSPSNGKMTGHHQQQPQPTTAQYFNTSNVATTNGNNNNNKSNGNESSISNQSNANRIGANIQLNYDVTPPKPLGMSEAEKKIEALTQEIEKEMEEKDPIGDYFGICCHCGEKVLGVIDACQAMGNLYHTNCFTCCSCGRPLRGFLLLSNRK